MEHPARLPVGWKHECTVPMQKGITSEGSLLRVDQTEGWIMAWFGFEPATMWLVGPTRPIHGPNLVTIEEIVGPSDAWAQTSMRCDTWRFLILGSKTSQPVY